jgi:Txe/YoeB family toxin of Txe-Axe toxin-antitoxin module
LVPKGVPDTIEITRQAKKDIDLLPSKLKQKLRTILKEVISENPYEGKRLIGDLAGSYSYRLTYQDRIVYSIEEGTKTVYIERARTHYGN